MFRTSLTLFLLMAGGLSISMQSGCDDGSYKPNSDPMGLESNDSSADPSDNGSTDLPEMPTMSDVERQENEQQSSTAE